MPTASGVLSTNQWRPWLRDASYYRIPLSNVRLRRSQKYRKMVWRARDAAPDVYTRGRARSVRSVRPSPHRPLTYHWSMYWYMSYGTLLPPPPYVGSHATPCQPGVCDALQ